SLNLNRTNKANRRKPKQKHLFFQKMADRSYRGSVPFMERLRYLAALGYDLVAEDVTNQGRIDLTLVMPDKVLIIEFKLTKFGSAMDAISQIKAKGYAEKYLTYGKPIYLIGISFDRAKRNVAELLFERYNSP
ncbi:PD-(D/E)XK nuclease domain-containing protein, partial [Facilibium subflavum]|uniref:PD-(D/E)XK nuclease domain-containing protein n=1 Tax=Facilibium subflavum TaxID=2219058 RepID=UPI001AAD8D41